MPQKKLGFQSGVMVRTLDVGSRGRGQYRVATTWMGNCLQIGELSRYTGWAKKLQFFSVDNLATVSGRKASDTSKLSEFCLEISAKNLHISALKYSLPNLHKCLSPLKLC